VVVLSGTSGDGAGGEGNDLDADGKIEFCSIGNGIMAAGWGHNGKCDVKWNSAGSAIHLMEDFDTLPSCAPFALPDVGPTARCLVIETVHEGAGYPRFSVVVSFRLMEVGE
jgi:hypothetical protein